MSKLSKLEKMVIVFTILLIALIVSDEATVKTALELLASFMDDL